MSSNNEACRTDVLKAAASQPLDSQSEKTRSRHEQEEKLILAAWQSMHSLSKKDSPTPGLPQSFLAKQRRSTQARRARSNLHEQSGSLY
ncbi:protein Hook homolog 2-like isoform X3 [Girardinichthys multiradiatus]|uniref:protein Hook homolog 2-like isoform X3 n=1 Tax=Girardinichthys multiradiatus TaxID=208333 RepID=UPI001FABCC56|nr:protein Hook homolog 2-like isoform X3 [Girardinichthys multiradiatus]